MMFLLGEGGLKKELLAWTDTLSVGARNKGMTLRLQICHPQRGRNGAQKNSPVVPSCFFPGSQF